MEMSAMETPGSWPGTGMDLDMDMGCTIRISESNHLDGKGEGDSKKAYFQQRGFENASSA
jgi:hypothetical protein